MDQPWGWGGGSVQVGGVSRQRGQADASQRGREGESGDERGGLGSSKVDGKPAVPPSGPRTPPYSPGV